MRRATVFIRELRGTFRVVIAFFSSIIVCHKSGMTISYKGLLKEARLEWNEP
jgi:hypothetical protein